MNKRISCIISSLGNGGAERVLSLLANALQSKGYEIIIYTLRGDKEYYPINNNIVHININTRFKNKYLKAIERFFRLRKSVKNDGSQVVIAFERFYGISASLFCKKAVIGSERNDPYSNMKLHSFQKYWRDWLYKRVNYVVFQTEYAKNYFSEKIQAHSCVIPNPISNNIPEPFQGERKKVIVAACRLEKQKNITMMLESFNNVYKKYPEYKLVIYGEGQLRSELELFLSTLDCRENVSMPGFVSDLCDKIKDASIYVSSSDFEGISNSMLEALALGIPTVCTDCPAGGAALAIENGKNGILVPVNDKNAFTAAIIKIIEDHEFAEKISKESISIRERFSVDKIIDSWEKVIKGL